MGFSESLRRMRVGNTPWFRRVRWALELCCFALPPGEEASGSGEQLQCFLLHACAGQSHRLAFRKKPINTQTITKPRSSLEIGLSFRSASLRFTTTTATHGSRVPTELCPTGPVVFCGSASHSVTLRVQYDQRSGLWFLKLLTRRRWCSASSCLLKTKTHHRQTLALPHEPSIVCCVAHMRVM